MTDAPVFLYLHIPKTGGSTLNSMLYTQYKTTSGQKAEYGWWRDGVYYLPDGFIRQPAGDIENQVRRGIQRPDTSAVLGHFAFGLHEYLDRPARYMTMLRDPIQRVLSLYHHMRQFKRIDPEMTVERFVSEPHVQEACNDQTRRLAGECVANACDRSTLTRAINNMESAIDIVGVTERFDASVLLAKKKFAWTVDIHYVPKLVNVARRTNPSEDLAQIMCIKQHNMLDLELYRYANQLLDQRIAQYGKGFGAELKAYTDKNQELLKIYGPASTVS